MTREVRMAAIAAAAVATAGHPESEVAYDADGKPIGATSVDIALRITNIADMLAKWMLRDVTPTLVEEAKKEIAATATSEEKLEQETERVKVADENFNVDQCPIHHKGLPSKYNTDMDPLFCGEEGCEWGRTDFDNKDEATGEITRVTKYRIVRGTNSWMYRDAYMADLRSRGVIK